MKRSMLVLTLCTAAVFAVLLTGAEAKEVSCSTRASQCTASCPTGQEATFHCEDGSYSCSCGKVR